MSKQPTSESTLPSTSKPTNVEELLVKVQEHTVKLATEGGELDVRFHIRYEAERGKLLRLSAGGKCQRAIAYSLHYEVPSSPTHRFIAVTLLGHVIHDLERSLIKQVAPLHSEEKEVWFRVDEKHSIKGHIDGILETEEGSVILDIKTANAKSFTEMVKNGPREDYIAQVNAYMDATGVHKAYLWLYNKDTSHRAVLPVVYDPKVVEKVRSRFRNALYSTPDNLPEREYEPQQEIRKGQPTDRLYLPWQCSYCPFVGLCWPDFEPVVEAGKIRYIKEE